MTAYLRPGVFVEETLNPLPPAVGPNAQSVAAFIGASDRGPVEPTLITSWSQFTSLYGGFGVNNLMHIAVLLFFSNGGGACYTRRTVGTGAQSATRDFNDRGVTPAAGLTINAANPGTWGNNINISIANSKTGNAVDLTVFYGGNTSNYVVEKFTDLTMGANDERYLVGVINSTSKYITAEDLGSDESAALRLPVVATNQSLATGANGATVAEGEISADVSAFDVVHNSLILNAPGVSATAAINTIVSYAASRGDAFVIIDPQINTVGAQMSLAATYTSSSYAASYYPYIVIKDPTSTVPGVTTNAFPGGAIAGIYASTDAARGVFKAPAGLAARLAGAVSVPTLTNTELDAMNSSAAAVNAIKYVTGSGIVVMGSRTLRATYVDKYVPVRRTLIYLRKSLTDLTTFAVFEPNDEKLWRRITAACDSFLRDFWRQGGLRGTTPNQAFFVKCDAETNPQTDIDNGVVNIEIGVALQRPAEFVIIKIGQFDGGTTVTVA
jgi:phage tail sheath protein FI